MEHWGTGVGSLDFHPETNLVELNVTHKQETLTTNSVEEDLWFFVARDNQNIRWHTSFGLTNDLSASINILIRPRSVPPIHSSVRRYPEGIRSRVCSMSESPNHRSKLAKEPISRRQSPIPSGEYLGKSIHKSAMPPMMCVPLVS
jgi:hypothetical protein